VSILDDVCADVAWSDKPQRLRANLKGYISEAGTVVTNKKLAEGDTKAIVLAGVRMGVYEIQRIGNKPVVVSTTPAEQEDKP
jgi:hypothetical protein